jgi:gliding motility-associated-like protein
LNDLFLPVGKSIAEIQFRVFDRWGELLFQTNDLETGWDGTYRGELVKNDMYVWRMTYTFFTDEDGTMGMEQSQIGQIQVLY